MTTYFPKIDVIIPCYNAENTLERAVKSALSQPELGTLWLVDDGSTDKTFAKMTALAAQFPTKIKVEQMPRNMGVAKARNWALLQSQAEFVAFLDADDEYEQGALQAYAAVFAFRPEISVVRLPLKAIGLPQHYAAQADFQRAWRTLEMTVVSNTAYRRAFLLACGGFPQDEMFRELGGEDGALGIATTQMSAVATLFDEPCGVLHYCREGMHAYRLFDALLFEQLPLGIDEAKVEAANAVTARIVAQITTLKRGLNVENFGVQPLRLEKTE